jgi:protein phosphatase
MRYLFGNAQHVGRREQQQDAFGFSNPFDEEFTRHAGLLAIVADGMGGMEHGDAASRTAVQAFLEAYRRKTPEEPIGAALERALADAQAAVLAVQQQFQSTNPCGTTFVAAVWHEMLVYWVAVGDSALYLCRLGQWTRLNQLHTYGKMLDERAARGEMSREEAQQDPQREALTSYLGIPQLVEIDRSVRPLVLAVGDWLLLASDGLYKSISLLDVPASPAPDLQARCEEILGRVLARELITQDNVTLVAVSFDCAVVPVTVAPQPRPFVAAPPLTRQGRSKKVPAAALALVVVLAGAYGYWRMTCCAAPPAAVGKDKPQLQNPNPVEHSAPPPDDPKQLQPPFK